MPMNEYGEIIRNSSPPPPIPEASNGNVIRRKREVSLATLREIEHELKKRRRRKILKYVLVAIGIVGLILGLITIIFNMRNKPSVENTSMSSTNKLETVHEQGVNLEDEDIDSDTSLKDANTNAKKNSRAEISDSYDLANAIEVKDFQELNKIRNNLSGTYVLTEDIDLSQCDWQPIGTFDAPFTGILIGNGHKIKGLKLDISTNETYDAGLFGVIDGGIISDIYIKSKIKLTCNGTKDSFANAGGICGRLLNGTIEKCSVTGKVSTVGKKSAFVRSGGIAGDVSHASEIKDCEVNVKISATAKASNTMAGGIAGWLENSKVERCLVKGKITGKNTKSYTYVGGINGSGTFAEVYSSVVLYKKITAKGSEVFADLISPYATSENNLVISTRKNNNTLSGTLITSKEKKNKDTYTDLGWDFDNVWKMKLFSGPTLQH